GLPALSSRPARPNHGSLCSVSNRADRQAGERRERPRATRTERHMKDFEHLAASHWSTAPKAVDCALSKRGQWPRGTAAGNGAAALDEKTAKPNTAGSSPPWMSLRQATYCSVTSIWIVPFPLSSELN